MKYKEMKKGKGLSRETKELYTYLGRSLFLCFVALFAIVTATVAWFVNNTSVNSGTDQVSAGFEPIKLAVSSRSLRQTAEQIILKLPEGEQLKDVDGNVITDSNGDFYYYTDSETIALRLAKNGYEVSPGAKGKIEFYVIPGGGSTNVTLQIELGAYGEDENKNINPINNSILTTLMKGHFLFFDNYENGMYSGWLLKKNGNNGYANEITIDLTGKEVGVPVKVDLYWIWPTRYENLVKDFDGSGTRIFADSQAESMIVIPNGYRYSYIYLTNKESLENVANRSEAYDLADEYIGSNAQYLYLKIHTGDEGVN